MERASMRILLLCLVAVAVLSPGAAGAQTTIADGVQAILRGDYQTAVRILRPLADEDAPQPDPLAQYFMAMLYDSGQGVSRNSDRACGLYLSAAKPANPLMSESLELAQFIQAQSGPFGAHRCSSASADRWRDPPSVSFTVGPGHSVTIDDRGATVLYNGTQTHTTMQMGGPGFVHLPTRHTQVDVSRPVDARRHFIQSFIWSPYRPFDPSAWTLHWVLNEVVGPDLISVDTGNQGLVTITAPEPPTSFDVDGAAGVRVAANGEAEWVIRSGPSPRSGVIPYKEPR
jgi:hypothetical protein